MARGSSARRYAQAAFEIAQEHNQLDQWTADLNAIAAVFSDPQTVGFLGSRTVRFFDKERFLIAVLPNISALAMNLARLLALKGGVAAAAGIAREYQAMLDRKRGVERGELVAAIDLTPQQQQSIASVLEKLVGSKVALTARKDPAIIGGLVARVGGKIVDGSVRSKLLDMRKDLEQAG